MQWTHKVRRHMIQRLRDNTARKEDLNDSVDVRFWIAGTPALNTRAFPFFSWERENREKSIQFLILRLLLLLALRVYLSLHPLIHRYAALLLPVRAPALARSHLLSPHRRPIPLTNSYSFYSASQ